MWDTKIYIHPGALNDYLFEQNLDRVKITAEMIDLEGDIPVENIEPVIQTLENLILTTDWIRRKRRRQVSSFRRCTATEIMRKHKMFKQFNT
ncbi:hypothetical protein IH992_29120, partial [Candidatus Poribacteria bacterium]|nr:hypothetical protein [Candidatus Poribacteria bacterium]